MTAPIRQGDMERGSARVLRIREYRQLSVVPPGRLIAAPSTVQQLKQGSTAQFGESES